MKSHQTKILEAGKRFNDIVLEDYLDGEDCLIHQEIKDTLESVRFDLERGALGAFWDASCWAPKNPPFDAVEYARWRAGGPVREEKREQAWLEKERLYYEEQEKKREKAWNEGAQEREIQRQKHRLRNAWRELIRTKPMVSLHNTFQGVVSYMARYVESSKHVDNVSPEQGRYQLSPQWLGMGFYPEEIQAIELTDKRYVGMFTAAAQHAEKNGYKLTVVDLQTWRVLIEGQNGSVQEGFFRALVVVPVEIGDTPK